MSGRLDYDDEEEKGTSLAQLVERRPFKPNVAGSSPAGSIFSWPTKQIKIEAGCSLCMMRWRPRWDIYERVSGIYF